MIEYSHTGAATSAQPGGLWELQKSSFFLRWNLQPLQKRRSPQTRCTLSCFRTSKRNKCTGFKNWYPSFKRSNKQLRRWKGKTPQVLSELEDRKPAALAEVLNGFVASKINITKKWMNNWNKASEYIGICNSKGQVYQQSAQERTTDLVPCWVWVAIRKTNKGTFYQSFSQYAIFVQCMSRWWRSYNL